LQRKTFFHDPSNLLLGQESVVKPLNKGLFVVWALHVHNQRSIATQKQNHLLAFIGGGIDFAMHGMRGNVKKVSSTDGDGVFSSGAALEASGPGNEIAIHVVISVMMPTGHCTGGSSSAKYLFSSVFEGEVPRNARA
jgi:hypothetical protein